MAVTALNPWLFNAIVQRFGRAKIYNRGIAHQGEPITTANGRPGWKILERGEEYIISCPFCREPDVNGHCHIGHRFGQRVENGARILGGGRCWKCDFQDKDGWLDRIEWLYRQLYLLLPHELQHAQPLCRGQEAGPRLDHVTYPGECVPLEQLPAGHHACEYLRSRNFDPVRLSREWGIAYCQDAPWGFRRAIDRIIIPVWQQGKMRTWQARYTGEPPQGTPKYWTCPQTEKSACLYGLDAALGAPWVLVVEGPLCVLRHGSGTVATLGKHVGNKQYDLLRQHWRTIVLALDGNALMQTEQTWFRLKQLGLAVVRVRLPEDRDPDKLGDDLWPLVLEAADREGVDLQTAKTPTASA